MLTRVLRHYGLEARRPYRVRAGNNNEHWFAGPDYVLRRYREGRPVDTVHFEHTLLRHLASRGWPVAVPIEATGGGSVIEMDGRLYALFQRLPGRRGIAEKPKDPFGLGTMLARLHRDMADCSFEPIDHSFKPLLSVSTTWGTGTHTVDDLYAAYARDAPEEAAYCTQILARVRDAVAGLDTSALPRGLIHGDWHAVNLLYTRGRVTGVLDFDFAHPDLRVADLAISSIVIDDDDAVALVRGYQSLEPLSHDELDLLLLHEQARLLGAVAATLSIRSRGGTTNAGPELLVTMLKLVEARWPSMRARLGLT